MTDLSRWPALVLTAGLATRLRPLSNLRAKAAVPVAGEPLVGRVLGKLRQAGIRRVVLNLHHRPETITSIVGDGAAWDLAVRYSWEGEVLGSAGGPARALPLLEADRFFIVNGDTLADVDLGALAANHLESGALVTMAVVDGDPRYNSVLADDRGDVVAFGRPGAGATDPFHFVGIQAADAAAFAGVAPDRPSETVKALYPALIARRRGAVRVFRSAPSFFDIGTPRDYLETAVALAEREGRAIDRGANVVVAPDAELTRTVLWDNVVIGAGASLTECVVTDGVSVPPGARFERCSLVMTDGVLRTEPF